MLADDTLVLTANQGWKLLREPVVDDRSLQAQLPSCPLLPPQNKLYRAWQSSRQPMYTLHLEAGFQVTCTADHEFAVLEEGQIQWRALRDLALGGSVIYAAGWEHHGPDVAGKRQMGERARQYLKDEREALEPFGDEPKSASDYCQPSPLRCPSASVRRCRWLDKRHFLQQIASKSVHNGWLARDPHITVQSEHVARYIHAEMLNMDVVGHVRMLDWKAGVSRIANRVYWTWSVQARRERERLARLLKCHPRVATPPPAKRHRGGRALDGCESLLAAIPAQRMNATERQLVREVLQGRARLTDVRAERLAGVLPAFVMALINAKLWTTAVHQIEPVGVQRGIQTSRGVQWLVAWGAITRQPAHVHYKFNRHAERERV